MPRAAWARSATRAESARVFGAEVRVNAPRRGSSTNGGRVTAWCSTAARSCARRSIVTAIHPKITFLQQLDAAELPVDS
jgi:hypothetical protein